MSPGHSFVWADSRHRPRERVRRSGALHWEVSSRLAAGVVSLAIAVLLVVPISPLEAAELTAIIDFESGLSAGDTPSTLSAGVGISGADLGTVSVSGSNPRFSGNAAMVFDSSCGGQSVPITDPAWDQSRCSGDDWDLYIPGQGNSLIITEDRDASDPDDESAPGGFFTFDFSDWGPGTITFKSLTLIDLESDENTAEIRFFDPDGNPIGTVPIVPTGGDNTTATTTADISGVGSVVLFLDHSGAIDDFVITSEVPVIDLELSKRVDDPSVLVGDEVTFTIDVTNRGADDATGVEVVDTLPAGMTYKSHATATGTFDTTTLAWSVGDIAAGNTVSLDVTVSVDEIGTLVNEAEVTAANESDSDSTPNDGGGDDWDDAVVEVTTRPEISIVKSPNLQTVAAGSDAAFTITVTNTGDTDLVEVAVSDPLAPACDVVIGDLAVGASASHQCTRVEVTQGFTNVATATGVVEATGVVVTDWDDAVVEVTTTCDLLVVLADGPAEGMPVNAQTGEPLITASGDQFVYLIAVKNRGCSVPVSGVIAELTLDDQLELDGPTDDCSIDCELVVCDIGTVAANDIATLTVGVRVRSEGPADDALLSRVDIRHPSLAQEADLENNSEVELTAAFGVAVKAIILEGGAQQLASTGMDVNHFILGALVAIALGALLLTVTRKSTRRDHEVPESRE